MAIIEHLREYIASCPILKEGYLNVDRLGTDITEYTIDTTPCDTIVRKYVDGSSIRQFEFVFASRESYGSDIPQNIDNSEFYEQFARQIENNNENLSNLLSLDNYQTAQYIELVTSGYAYDVGDNSARYQIQLRLVYYQDRRYR